MKTLDSSRRTFITTAIGGAGALLLGQTGCGGSRPGDPTPGCDETEVNPLGPYYREDAPFRSDLATGQPGTVLRLEGFVLGGPDCRTPLEGALLDVWQADEAGAYDNDSPDFLFRGRLYTGTNGRYSLRTIMPGRYELAPGQFRPAHLHVKLSAPGHRSLITQLYFAGDPFNESDAMFLEELVVETTATGGELAGSFTFVLAEEA